MTGENKTVKIFGIIKHNMLLRILGMLNVIFLIFIIVFLAIGFSYGEKILMNKQQIESSRQALESLVTLAELKESKDEETLNILQKKSFAKYDEVVTFIAILESLFSTIDPKSEITVKSKEEQIYLDHYADYSVLLKVGEDKKELFLKALDELYNSRFITKIINFTINYKPPAEDNLNEMEQAELTIRLYLD